MRLDVSVEARAGYHLVRASGSPDMGGFLAFLDDVATESSGWEDRRLLLDLREVASIRCFVEQFAIGEAAARKLNHLGRVASLVLPERRTGNSERPARRSGLDLRVFTDEAEAIAWLREPAGPRK